MKIVFNPESILYSDNFGVLKWENRREGENFKGVCLCLVVQIHL
jgi:hypothetical protein